MKQLIPFTKEIDFRTTLYEITSIALEHNLKIENNDSVVGEFIVSGKYRINNISINEEDFKEIIPFDITLDDKYDADKIKIDIDDFYYEILNGKLNVHIDVLVDNLIYLKKEDEKMDDNKNDVRTADEEIIIEESCDTEETTDSSTKEVINDIASNILDKECYVTYKVHIVREDQGINDIINMYNVKKEELEKYNNLDNIMIGTKIVIPINNE